ncbi:hypothetical protein niasHT_017535 [Heterodera trifolii]|uniref:Apple domain-containing protein n=1 Tax=Heterodera trifolii TaxID=157864 RepID=A0ABD2L604_9BILA
MPLIFVPNEHTLLLIMSLLILMILNNDHQHYGRPVLAQSDLETAADLTIFTNRPPRARLFVGKPALHHHHHQQVLAPVIAASPPSPTTLAQMMHANPLLATLSMFNDNNNDNDDISNNKLETLGIGHGSQFGTETTTAVPKTVTVPSLLAKSQFKSTKAKGRVMQIAATANASSSLSAPFLPPNPSANFGTTKTATAPPQQQQQQQQQQMDNFDMLYQIFNVSMFDLADQQQEEKPEEVDRLPFLLPLVTRAEERRRTEASKHRNAIANNRRLDGKFDYRSDLVGLGKASDQEPAQAQQEAVMIVGVDEMLDEEDNTTLPFEITDALTNALSSPNGGIMPTTTTAMAQIVGDDNGTGPREEEDKQLTALQAQEQFPLDELRRRLKYPWERERGEHGTMSTMAPAPGATTMAPAATVLPADAIVAPSSSSLLSSAPILASPPATALPPLPSVMPGASFYVDQHVSRGSFGRDRADSTPNLVYDPNVLQSRYGFGGLLLLAEAVPLDDNDDRLVRGQQRWPPPADATTRQRGPYAYHWPILAASAGAPASSSVLPSAAAAVFIIPPSPRLSVARAVVPSLQGTRAETAPPPQGANGGEHSSPAEGGAKSAAANGDKRLGFWPQQSSSSSNGSANCGQGQQKQSVPLATTAKAVPNGGEALVPFNGNHLQWVPARVAAKGVPTSSANRRTTEEEEEDNLGTNSDTGTRRWPCLADPVDLVLADSPPAVGQPIAVCFRRMRQCVLRRAPPPLQRRVGLSRVECIQFCVGHGQCSSLTYAHPSSTCELFLTRNGTGTAQLFHHREFDYFESKLGHGTALRDCWDDFLPHDGPDDNDNDDNDDDGNFGPNPAPSTVKQLLIDSGDELGGQQRDTLYYSNRTTVPYPSSLTTTTQTTTTTMTTMSSTTTTTPAGAAPREACASADRDIVVFKSKGYRLATPAGAGGGTETADDGATTAQNAVLTQHSSETECSFSCLVNMANGVTPFECLAATFDSMLAQCALHGIGSSADGSIHLVPDSAFSHYEKGCILTEIVELCRGYPIIRYPQKTLLGFAIGTRRAASLLDCLELCLAHNNFNSNHHHSHRRQSPAPSSSSSSSSTAAAAMIWCRSVVFFYEESAIAAVVGGAGADDGSSVGTGGGDGQNCVLNSESGDSAPQFFVDETEALVDYATFDDCYQLGDADTDADDANGVQGTLAAAAATPTGGEKRSTAASGMDKMGMDSDAGGGRAASSSRAHVAESRSRPQKKALPKLHKLRPLPEERQQQQHHKQQLLLGHDHEAVGLKNIGLKWRRRMGGQKIVFPSDNKNVQHHRPLIGGGGGQFGTNTAHGRGQASLTTSISGKQPPPRATVIQLTAPAAESATAAAQHQRGPAMAAQHQRGKGDEEGQQQQIVAELSAVYSVEEEEGARKINNDHNDSGGVSGREAAETKGVGGGERQRHQQRQQQTMRVEGQTKMAQRQRHRWSSSRSSKRRRK